MSSTEHNAKFSADTCQYDPRPCGQNIPHVLHKFQTLMVGKTRLADDKSTLPDESPGGNFTLPDESPEGNFALPDTAKAYSVCNMAFHTIAVVTKFMRTIGTAMIRRQE